MAAGTAGKSRRSSKANSDGCGVSGIPPLGTIWYLSANVVRTRTGWPVALFQDVLVAFDPAVVDLDDVNQRAQVGIQERRRSRRFSHIARPKLSIRAGSIRIAVPCWDSLRRPSQREPRRQRRGAGAGLRSDRHFLHRWNLPGAVENGWVGFAWPVRTQHQDEIA